MHIENEFQNSQPRRIVIGEVKYAAGGKPVLGVIKMNGKEWRQLSVPYVINRLERMSRFSVTRDLAQTIKNSPNSVELELAVFNPDSLNLIIYRV